MVGWYDSSDIGSAWSRWPDWSEDAVKPSNFNILDRDRDGHGGECRGSVIWSGLSVGARGRGIQGMNIAGTSWYRAARVLLFTVQVLSLPGA